MFLEITGIDISIDALNRGIRSGFTVMDHLIRRRDNNRNGTHFRGHRRNRDPLIQR